MQTHKIPPAIHLLHIYVHTHARHTETVRTIYTLQFKGGDPASRVCLLLVFTSSPNLISSFMCANTMYDQRVSVWIIYVLPSVIYIIIIHNLLGRYIYNVLCCVWLFNERCFADHVRQYAADTTKHTRTYSQTIPTVTHHKASNKKKTPL